MKRTANNSCRTYVQARTPFQGSNLFAERRTATRPGADAGTADRYIVYSYGYHWPLFIFVPKSALPDGTPVTDGIWFENEEKSSRSTNRQKSQAHPLTDTVKLPCAAMKDLAESGRVSHAIVLNAAR